ncbi:MAG: hypothetical protein AAF514_17270, partial [Verrucomicrobiota bacterium]
GALWLHFRQDMNRGFKAAFHDHFVGRRIVNWTNPFADRTPENTSLHLLTGESDWLLSLWMLASFTRQTERNWKIVYHDDGTMPDEAFGIIKQSGLSVRFIRRAEADEVMSERLKRVPRCLDYRSRHPLALKAFDVLSLEENSRCLLFDSDVLFFQRPSAILDWCDQPDGTTWFNRDLQEPSLISADLAQSTWNIQLWPRVNSGLCLLDKGLLDLTFCEEALALEAMAHGKIWRTEQTLLALMASKAGHGGLLPDTYEVSLSETRIPQGIARHYVGAVRHQFYAEGMSELKMDLLRRTPGTTTSRAA